LFKTQTLSSKRKSSLRLFTFSICTSTVLDQFLHSALELDKKLDKKQVTTSWVRTRLKLRVYYAHIVFDFFSACYYEFFKQVSMSTINRKGVKNPGIRFLAGTKQGQHLSLDSSTDTPKKSAPQKTWNEAVSLWLEETRTKTTHEEDKKKLEWLNPYLTGVALTEITSEVITQIRSASSKVLTRTGLPRTQSTTNRYLALVRSILIKAKDEWEWLERVPKIKLFKEPPGRVRFLSPEEAKRLLDELPEHLLAVIRFDLATGLRLSNVAKLKWSDIDFARAHAWVGASDSKSRKAIAIDLNIDAIEALKGELGKHPVRVFTYKGKPLDNLNTRAWRNALKRAGISDFRFHDLRHTWASWHRQSGTPAHELQVMGGWSSSVMVERYAHLGKDVIAGASKRIESIIPK